MAPDMWERLLYDTIKSLLGFCTPFLGLWLLTLIFKDITKTFTGFIVKAMKSEFKTDVGKTNLLGILFIFLLLVIPGISIETSASTKGFILGLFFLASLFITYLQDRKHRVTENKDDK